MNTTPTAEDLRRELLEDLMWLEDGEQVPASSKRAPLIELARAAVRRAIVAEAEVQRLRRQIQGHCERTACQSEPLSRRAERPVHGSGGEVIRVSPGPFLQICKNGVRGVPRTEPPGRTTPA